MKGIDLVLLSMQKIQETFRFQLQVSSLDGIISLDSLVRF